MNLSKRIGSAASIAWMVVAIHHHPCSAQSLDSPMTRLQPIGAPSQVDRYRSDTRGLQIVRLPQNGFAEPPTGFNPPPSSPSMPAPSLPLGLPPGSLPSQGTATQPTLPPSSGGIGVGSPNLLPRPGGTTAPPASLAPAPRVGLPMGPGAPSSSDFQPIPQPQLGSLYANVDNCACVTGPSGYSAASVGCGTPLTYVAPAYGPAPTYGPVLGYAAPPSTLVPPTLMPNQVAPLSQNVAPLPSLFTLGQQYNPVQVGQGIIGQPVAYVPGQTIRNFFRYLFP